MDKKILCVLSYHGDFQVICVFFIGVPTSASAEDAFWLKSWMSLLGPYLVREIVCVCVCVYLGICVYVKMCVVILYFSIFPNYICGHKCVRMYVNGTCHPYGPPWQCRKSWLPRMPAHPSRWRNIAHFHRSRCFPECLGLHWTCYNQARAKNQVILRKAVGPSREKTQFCWRFQIKPEGP